jgi:hypothetical protein
VDPALPYLQPFVQAHSESKEPAMAPGKRMGGRGANKPTARMNGPRNTTPRPASAQLSDDSHHPGESEDFTEDDLRRLQGEISIASKPQKKRRH